MYRFRSKNLDVVAAVGLAILGCAAVVGHLPGPVVIVLGLGLFVSPGYVWSEVLLSRTVATLERVVVGIGIGFMVPVLGGLALHAAGISIYRKEWIGLLAATTIVGAFVLTVQRLSARPAAEGEEPARQAAGPRLPFRHLLGFGLAAVIAMAAVTLAVVGAEAQKSPGFTELWLTPQKNDQDQQEATICATSCAATLGVTNDQGGPESYRVVLASKPYTGKKAKKQPKPQTWNVTLANGESWRQTVTYTTKYPMTATLYLLPNLSQPFRTVDNGE